MASGSWGERAAPRHWPCLETVVVAAICLLDLVTTVVLLHRGEAVEGNPLMAYFV